MKKTVVIVIALLLAITLLPACKGGGGGEEGAGGGVTPPGGTPSGYTGFMAAREGQWADYTTVAGGTELHQIWEYIGVDRVDRVNCIGFEMTMAMPGEESIMQIWTDVATQQLVKYVVKAGGVVMCMDVSQFQYEPPETETPSEYAPDTPDISYGTYTVPGNGQTVNVAIFKVEPGIETWVSSEVPFGIVKVIAPEMTMSLNNFGLSGAVRDISEKEMEDCLQFQIPGY